MRLFDLFLRRAGLNGTAAIHNRRTVSRLTVECPNAALGDVRKQICLNFEAAGLNVTEVRVDRGQDPDSASACVTLDCPPERRTAMVEAARRLTVDPRVRRVQWGDSRRGRAVVPGEPAAAA